MALIKADRVKETSTSTGTGTIALAGAATGYRAFSAVCAVGDTCYYAIAHQTAGEWEVGLATYSAANTLTRTTVHASSNSNLAVTFSAGTKDVFLSVTKAWLDTFVTQTSNTTNYVAKTTGTGTIGDSQIFDNGTNVGIGTTSPSGKLHVKSSGSSTWPLYVQGSGGNFLGGFYQSSSDNCGLYIADSAGNYKAQIIAQSSASSYIATGANFGIGETSPGAQLHVTTSAAAVKGLIVKGASAQSANLQEWQNSSGTVLASIASDGGFSVTNSTALIARDSAYTDWTGQLILQGVTDNRKRMVLGIDTTNNLGFLQTYLNSGGTTYPIIVQPSHNGGASTVGIGSVTAPDGQLHVSPHLADRKALVVRAKTSQTANLTEWQNSAGASYASINSNFGASFHGWNSDGPHGGSEQVCLSAGNKSYWASGDAALMTIGFVDIAGVYDGTNWSMYFKTGSSGSRSERMRITHTGNVGIGTTSPDSKLHAVGNIKAKFTTYHLSLTGDLPGYTAGAIPTLKSDATKIWFSSNNNAIGAWGTDTAFQGIELYAVGSGTGARINTNPSGVSYIADGNVGIGTTSPGAQLQVTTAAAATKGLIVKGAAAQSASIFEVQDSNGRASVVASSSFGTTIVDSFGQLFVQVNDAVAANIGAQISLGGNYVGTTSTVFGAISAKKENATSGNYAGYLQLITSTNGIGNTEKVRITSTGEVGIGTTLPSEKLHVVGNVRAGNYTGGAGTYVALTGDLPGYASGLFPNIKSDGTIHLSANGKYTGYIGDNQNTFGILSYTTANGVKVLFNPDGTSYFAGGPLTVGLGVGGASPSQLYVAPQAAATKGLVVRGASGQSANLQEWQNSSGTALALVDASGNVRTTGSIQITSNTPSAFTVDQNDLALSASGFQRLSGTAARTITGIAPPSGASHVDGRIMRIYNVGSYNITLKHNSTSSLIANRFCCVQAIDIVLGPRDFAELIYDATDGGLVSGQNNPCWRVA